jgi:hypothetical protein
MTPDEQRAAYRKGCSYARKGHVIHTAADGWRSDEVYKTFTRTVRVGNEKVTVPAINAAKRWVAEQPAGSVFVDD